MEVPDKLDKLIFFKYNVYNKDWFNTSEAKA